VTRAHPERTAERLDLRREEDLEVAYRRYAGELHRFLARALRDHAAAADVVQEVFVRAWRHADRYDPATGSLRAWLYAIARNAAVDHARRARSRPGDRAPTAPDDLQALSDRPRGAAGDGFSDELVDAWLLTAALRRLPADQRAVLVETHLRGRPYAEVAAEWRVPVGTLRSRAFHGLRRLRAVMDEMGATL
jgi:RNA polymerase sigma-70 factor, ECF subfamily